MTDDLDDAYANSAHIPGGEDYPARWAEAAAAFRRTARGACDLSYGPGPRQRFDLFLPAGSPSGLMVFVHGGYWRASDRKDWSHLAAGALAIGWACAMPSYDLAPNARISEITRQIARAIDTAATRVPGPLRLAGHSAGGHLVARMLCGDVELAARARLTRAVPISPLGDLAPLMGTAMNRELRLDVGEAQRESPHFRQPMDPAWVHLWVGGDERPAFLDQARRLSHAWAVPLTVDPGRHHFDVIDGLGDPQSALMAALIGP